MGKRVLISRVELLYRAGIDCPLRKVTHQPNGDPKPEWTFFTSLQSAIFCEWILPCRLPPQIQSVTSPTRCAVLVTGPWNGVQAILNERQIHAVNGDVTKYINALENALIYADSDWIFYLHPQYNLRRNKALKSSLQAHLAPQTHHTPLSLPRRLKPQSR